MRSRFEVFAEDWYAAWNSHDLERIVGHYAKDVVFASPFLAALDESTGGELRGLDALRRYFALALRRYPRLRFEPIEMFAGARSVVLHYISVDGLLAAETMELDDHGLVVRALAHYRDAAENDSLAG